MLPDCAVLTESSLPLSRVHFLIRYVLKESSAEAARFGIEEEAALSPMCRLNRDCAWTALDAAPSMRIRATNPRAGRGTLGFIEYYSGCLTIHRRPLAVAGPGGEMLW